MISPEEAWKRLQPHTNPLGSESRRRSEALGSTLSQALPAKVDVPASDVSAMDGYALAATVAPGAQLRVTGLVAAGDPPGATLEPDGALRIMTGAPVPVGADRVVPIEDTDGGAEEVTISRPPEPNAHIRKRGEILHRGATLLDTSSLLTPGALGLLATHGYTEVPVFKTPSIAVLSTGDEVISPDQTPKPGQLRDSHTDFLLAATATTGIQACSLGISPDEPTALEELAREGMKRDVLILSGGVSMGEFDFVPGVLEKLGCKILFAGVSIQPGKPVVVAVRPGGLVFGLPGNPASAMVAFWILVRPALRRLMGLQDSYWYGALTGRLEAPLPGARGRDRFLPARVRFEEGEILVEPAPPLGSHDLAAYARGTALVRVPAGSEELAPGATCSVLPLANWASP